MPLTSVSWMDKNNFSFQMFLILLSFFALGSESHISVFKQCQSNSQMSVVVVCLFVCFFWGGGMHRSQNLEIVIFQWRKILHAALHLVQFLTSFIGFYFEILSYLACGEKIITLASKNSVKLGKKWTSDFRRPSAVCSDEGLTLETSAKHHIPPATNIPYQPCWSNPYLAYSPTQKNSFFQN